MTFIFITFVDTAGIALITALQQIHFSTGEFE